MLAQRVTAAELAQHHPALRNAQLLGLHDFVGGALAQHAVLMNAALVHEGVGAHHGLVGWKLHAAEARGQAAQAVELADVEVVLQAVDIPAGAQAHHDLVQRGVARALAQAR